MATQIRSNLSDFFGPTKLPVLEQIILTKAQSYQSMIPILFNQQSMTSDIYQTTTHSTLRNPVVKGEAQPIQFQSMQKGFSKTFTALNYATGFRISKEMLDDGKESLIQKAIESFSKGQFEVQEYAASGIFDNAFTAGGSAGPDGKALCAVDHLLENGGGAVGVNRSATDTSLSITSFRELRNLMQQTVNENGQLVKYEGQYLVVPYQLQDTAAELVKSTYRPDNANNAINTIYDTVKLLPGGFWNYLTDANSFFLVSDKMNHSLMFLNRTPLVVDTDYDKKAQCNEIMASCRFTQGFGGWRGVTGNAGA